jgi:GTP-binding protein HflX
MGTPLAALLVTVVDSDQQDIEESVQELKELLKTSGGVTVDSMIQRPKRLHPRLLIGRGKLTEIAIRCMQLGVDLIIFNRDLYLPHKWHPSAILRG